jgi:hypothetical protein
MISRKKNDISLEVLDSFPTLMGFNMARIISYCMWAAFASSIA